MIQIHAALPSNMETDSIQWISDKAMVHSVEAMFALNACIFQADAHLSIPCRYQAGWRPLQFDSYPHDSCKLQNSEASFASRRSSYSIGLDTSLLFALQHLLFPLLIRLQRRPSPQGSQPPVSYNRQ